MFWTPACAGVTVLQGTEKNVLEVVLAYLFIIGFFAAEIFLRPGASAKSLETTTADQGSTRLIGVSIGVSVILPVLLNLLRVGQLASPFARWLGLLLMLLGLGVR